MFSTINPFLITFQTFRMLCFLNVWVFLQRQQSSTVVIAQILRPSPHAMWRGAQIEKTWTYLTSTERTAWEPRAVFFDTPKTSQIQQTQRTWFWIWMGHRIIRIEGEVHLPKVMVSGS